MVADFLIICYCCSNKYSSVPFYGVNKKKKQLPLISLGFSFEGKLKTRPPLISILLSATTSYCLHFLLNNSWHIASY